MLPDGENHDTLRDGEPPDAPAPLDRGTCVGRYVLLGVLGQGGMGVVYKAYDPELERAVALKLLRASGASRAAAARKRERLLREAKALARLAHPNVVAVHDVGTYGGDVFVAMEFVEGVTVRAWLAEAPRPAGEVLRVFRAAGEGLAAAHRAGLVHRDFKPENIILGVDGRPRVLDFGLARAAVSGGLHASSGALKSSAPTAWASAVPLDDEGADVDLAPSSSLPLDVPLTRDGVVLGTPRYMAPEQHRGEQADERSDQFAFSVALYEALYGVPPFAGQREELRHRVLAGHVGEPPADVKVPRWLRLVLLRGLAANPAERYPTMAALLVELRRDVRALRRRVALVVSAAFACSAAAGAYGFAKADDGALCRGAEAKLVGVWDEARKRAVEASFRAAGVSYADNAFRAVTRSFDAFAARWVAMRTEACAATRIRGEQSEALLDLRMQCLGERLDRLRARVDVLAAADAKVVEAAFQIAEADLALGRCADGKALRAAVPPPEDPAARERVEALRLRLARAKALEEAGRYAEGVALAPALAAEASALRYRPLEAEALYVTALLREGTGEYAVAAALLEDAALAAEASHDDALAARAWTRLVWVTGDRRSRFDEAHRWARFAEASIQRLGDPDAELGELLRTVGDVHYREQKYEEATADGERALALLERAHGPEHSAVALALRDLGNVQWSKGHYDEALRHYGRALAIAERTLGEGHPHVATILNNVGNVHGDRGERDAALANYRRALAIWERTLGPTHPYVALALFNLAVELRGAGRLDEALAASERALALHTSVHGPEHVEVASALCGLGEVRLGRREPELALESFRRCLAIREKVQGPRHPDVVEALLGIAEALALREPKARALEPLERAFAIVTTEVSAAQVEPGYGADVRFALGRLLWDLGRSRDRARQLVAEARALYGTNETRFRTALDETNAWLTVRGTP